MASSALSKTTPVAGQSGAATPGTSVQQFKIKVPKNMKKRHHVMRFNATLNVDFATWMHVKMERENNMKEYKGMDEEMPKFGAGSEYGRDAREEARRKKFGIVARKYKPEDQPWILKAGGKIGKKFKGIREGGVSENAAYYVFTHGADGVIEAYPLQEWYNFQPIQRYKALSAEEAEHEFGRRNKVMNFFSLMMRKRLKGDDADGDIDEQDDKKTKSAKAKELKISEMDEWMDSDDDSSDSDADKEKEDSDSNAKKKAKAKNDAKNKKKKKKVEDEAFEESDDGDEEGREKDYISDSSESESDVETKTNKELKSVAEEDALRKLLTSDEDTDEEEEKRPDSENEEEKERAAKETEEKAKRLTKKRKRDDAKKGESSGELSSDSDTDPEPSVKKKSSKESKESPKESKESKESKEGSVSAGSSRSATPVPVAASAAAPSASATPHSTKKLKLDSNSDNGVSEEAVRRYLMRKPMTTTELLTKFKSRKSGVSSERLVETMTQILKRINPLKQTIKGKMYLSIKS